MGYIEDLRAKIGQEPVNLCGSVVVVVNGAGQILLERRREIAARWGLPGGLAELGESFEGAAKREVLEETGLSVHQLHLLGVYSDYPLVTADNGDQFYTYTAAFVCKRYNGSAQAASCESKEIGWFLESDLPEVLVVSHQEILRDYFAGEAGGRR